MTDDKCVLSAVISVRNEEKQLADCLDGLTFADEVVVLLDKCTDGSREIASRYTDRLIDGDWQVEGDRRNAGIEACRGDWIFEVDADERVSEELAREIRAVVSTTTSDWHCVPVDNYIGDRLVRYGWGAYYGKSAYPGLFKNGVKRWGGQRVHPTLHLTGAEGPALTHRLVHYVDRNISDMIRRLDSYTTARARDLRESGGGGSFARNVRRMFSRFWKCYVLRKGYREGKFGFLIALFAALYPLLSHMKATLEDD